MIGNYERILEKISKSSGIEKEEIERRIEAKRAKLSGLISKEGAAQIIAAELGINFDNEKLKIQELLPGMRRVNLVGKVIQLFPVRNFVRNGKEGKVANFVIADDTSNIRVVLWDTNHIGLIEKGDVIVGTMIEISNASVRENEIHLGSFSELKTSSEIFEDVRTEKILREKKISEFKISDNVKSRAFIVQVFEPRFFEVCPQCGKKANKEGENSACLEHGKVICERRAVLNIVIDDGTATIRSVIFHGVINNLGINVFEQENFLKQREELLGKEMIFFGMVRNNKFFNTPEFIVDEIKDINLDEILQKLEK